MGRKRKAREQDASSAVDAAPAGDGHAHKKTKTESDESKQLHNESRTGKASSLTLDQEQANPLPDQSHGSGKRKRKHRRGTGKHTTSLKSSADQPQAPATIRDTVEEPAAPPENNRSAEDDTAARRLSKKRRRQAKHKAESNTPVASTAPQVPAPDGEPENGQLNPVSKLKNKKPEMLLPPATSDTVKHEPSPAVSKCTSTPTANEAVPEPSQATPAVSAPVPSGKQSAASDKRRRRKQRKSLLSSSNEDTAVGASETVPTNGGTADIAEKVQDSPATPLTSPPVAEDTHRSVSQTVLMRPPVKKWVTGPITVKQSVEDHDTNVDNDTATDRSTSQPNAAPKDPVDREEQDLPHTSIAKSSVSDSGDDESASTKSSDSDGSETGPNNGFSINTRMKPTEPREPIMPVSALSHFSRFGSPASQYSGMSGIDAIKQRLLAARHISATDTAPSQKREHTKVNSIPSFNVTKDPEKAFKRFAAFTRGKQAGESASESSESESDSDSSDSSSDSNSDKDSENESDDSNGHNARDGERNHDIEKSVHSESIRHSADVSADTKAGQIRHTISQGNVSSVPSSRSNGRLVKKCSYDDDADISSSLERPAARTTANGNNVSNIVGQVQTETPLSPGQVQNGQSEFQTALTASVPNRDEPSIICPRTQSFAAKVQVPASSYEEIINSTPTSDETSRIPNSQLANTSLTPKPAHHSQSGVAIAPDVSQSRNHANITNNHHSSHSIQPSANDLDSHLLGISDFLNDEDLNRSIADISKAVFESTHPLPRSKEILKQHDSKLDGLTESHRHYRRVLTHELGSLQNRTSPDSVDWTTPACKNRNTDDWTEGELASQSSKHRSEGRCNGGGSMSMDSQLRRLGSSNSSSLSEIPSCSPSPPKGASQSHIETSQNVSSFKCSEDESHRVTENVSAVVKPSDAEPDHGEQTNTNMGATEDEKPTFGNQKRKRQMTGITSKHFEPIARRTRRQSNRVAISASMPEAANTPADRDSAEMQLHSHDPNGIKAESTLDLANNCKLERSPGPLTDATSDSGGDSESECSSVISGEGRYSRTKQKRQVAVKQSRKPRLKALKADPKSPDTSRPKRIAGVSMAPVPPIGAAKFGLVQERLFNEPFKLLAACLFLNQTAGKVSMPVFFSLIERYPTIEDLSNAEESDLFQQIAHLGFGNLRSRKLINMAKTWLQQPPELGKRYRAENYPVKGDHRGLGKNDVQDDSEQIGGAIEIAHIPGCGPYAYDSWRIFCRDVLRGVAEDYNGLNAKPQADGEPFEPEWKRVLPKDKELRACLRWMWLREGWIWNAETGDRRKATTEEMESARQGQMQVEDEKEKKFAEAAVQEHLDQEL